MSANPVDRYEAEFNSKLRSLLFGLLDLWRLFQLHCCLPRKQGRVLSPSEPNATGKWNFPAYTFPATPFYVKQTFWNQWGPIAMINRLRGLPIPGPQFLSNGVHLESMGAKRSSISAQTRTEINVLKEAELINNSSWGYRPKVNYQSWPVVLTDMGTSYGSSENTYSETATEDTRRMGLIPNKY